MMLVNSSVSKKGSKSKKKMKKPMKVKEDVTKKKAKETTLKGTCFHYHKDGNWKRNCKAYLGSLNKKASDAPIYFTVHDNMQDNVKPSYLWHCRLNHINERCMAKLHKSGTLGSFD